MFKPSGTTRVSIDSQIVIYFLIICLPCFPRLPLTPIRNVGIKKDLTKYFLIKTTQFLWIINTVSRRG